MKPALTPEQAARDMFERMGVDNAQFFSAGDIVELANLLNAVRGLTREDVLILRDASAASKGAGDGGEPWAKAFDSLADRIEALLPKG